MDIKIFRGVICEDHPYTCAKCRNKISATIRYCGACHLLMNREHFHRNCPICGYAWLEYVPQNKEEADREITETEYPCTDPKCPVCSGDIL